MENKKYYWLKLKDNFYQEKIIRKLRSLEGGDTGVIVYQKLLLESMSNDGKIEYVGFEDSFCEEIAFTIDEDVNVTANTITFLIRFGLAQLSDDNRVLFIPGAVENTGDEQSSAQRVREFRRRQKELSKNNSPENTQNENVTSCNVTCNADVTVCNEECNTEKETDTDTKQDTYSDEDKKDISSADVFHAVSPQDEIIFYLSDSQKYVFSENDISILEKRYPDVDVKDELIKMMNWTENNPDRRKPRAQMYGFVHKWLKEKQDRKYDKQQNSKPVCPDKGHLNTLSDEDRAYIEKMKAAPLVLKKKYC